MTQNITPRRLAAARRSLKKQAERYSLFSWAGTALEEGLISDATPEARIERVDRENKEWFRQGRIRTIRIYREILKSIPETCRQKVVDAFRESNYPVSSEYFADFVHTRCRKCFTRSDI